MNQGDGWKKFGDSCYFLGEVKKTWHDAKTDCRALQSDLASIHSIHEEVFLSSMVNIEIE